MPVRWPLVPYEGGRAAGSAAQDGGADRRGEADGRRRRMGSQGSALVEIDGEPIDFASKVPRLLRVVLLHVLDCFSLGVGGGG